MTSSQVRAMADRLRTLELFQGCTDVELEGVAQLGQERSVAIGERLITRGENSGDAFVILEGRARVSAGDQVLDYVGPGEVIGEMGALNPSLPRSASVVAKTDMLLLGFSEAAFAELLNIPTIDRRVLRSLADRLHASIDTIAD